MMSEPRLTQWLVPTDILLSTVDISLPPKEQRKQFFKHMIMSSAFSLLTPTQRESVLKYFFPRDAAMSLVSHLLKSLIIKESINRPWPFCVASQNPDVNSGKPYYVSRLGEAEVSFNVSHQAGVVALIAMSREGAGEYDLGIDVVCVDERDEVQKVLTDEKGWQIALREFVEMHEEVFSPREISALVSSIRQEAGGGLEKEEEKEEAVRRILRRFYALWCLREAYVKMTGDALLADWLGELEFRRFDVPGEGEAKDDVEIWFKGRKVEGVRMRIVGVGASYMIASAVRTNNGRKWEGEWADIEDLTVMEVVRRATA